MSSEVGEGMGVLQDQVAVVTAAAATPGIERSVSTTFRLAVAGRIEAVTVSAGPMTLEPTRAQATTVLTALMVTGRAGSAIATELGMEIEHGALVLPDPVPHRSGVPRRRQEHPGHPSGVARHVDKERNGPEQDDRRQPLPPQRPRGP
mgnify:CR=1 FL=1